jgi:Polyketide cyclase / dehydrase and lipid transport
MANVKVEDRIAAPIDDVWKVVSDFVHVLRIGGMNVEGDGEGIGMTRTITMGDNTFVERLEAQDDATHTTSYSIVSGPLPVSDYYSTIQLEPAGDSATAISWNGRFEPAGIPEDQAVALIRGVYENGVKSLQKHFA